MLLLQKLVLSAEVLMLQRETAGKVVVPERVHCPAGRSRDKHLRKGYSHLCGGCCHTADGGMVLTWRSGSTAVVHCATDVARQGWRDDGLGPDQVGRVCRERWDGPCACSSNGRSGGRR